MKKILAATCLLAGVMAGATDSQAVILDFESLLHNDDQIVDHAPSYTESGFQLLNTATEESSGYAPTFATLGSEVYGFTGSAALFNNNYLGESVLSTLDGVAFNLRAISLAELLPVDEAFAVTFNGVKADGSMVSRSFTLDGSFGAETFSFGSDFTNLMTVSWLQDSYFHQFDNIDVAPVPEPSTLLLLGAGLVGVIAGRKKLGKINFGSAAV
jgi:hypothetical protein